MIDMKMTLDDDRSPATHFYYEGGTILYVIPRPTGTDPYIEELPVMENSTREYLEYTITQYYKRLANI